MALFAHCKDLQVPLVEFATRSCVELFEHPGERSGHIPVATSGRQSLLLSLPGDEVLCGASSSHGQASPGTQLVRA